MLVYRWRVLHAGLYFQIIHVSISVYIYFYYIIVLLITIHIMLYQLVSTIIGHVIVNNSPYLNTRECLLFFIQVAVFEHQKALTNLRKDRSITIKPADKGTCIVIQDTKQYLLEGLKELEDRSTYVELDADTSLDTARQANELIKDCHLNKKLLSVFEKNHYTTDIKDVRAQRLYWLRTVHKNPHQLRPIVSCCSGPTQKLSQLCNNLLKEYLGSVQSLISSTGETVRIIESLKVPPDSRKALILATLDVKALYPSIPHEAGISMALQQAIPTDPPVPSDYPKKAMIKEMLKIILAGNTFQFAGRTFK